MKSLDSSMNNAGLGKWKETIKKSEVTRAPQDLVEPQYSEGYFEGRRAFSAGSFISSRTILSLWNTIRNQEYPLKLSCA